MWLEQYLLQESTKADLVLVTTVLDKTKTHPELVAKTYNKHNDSTKKDNDKKDNNKETEGAPVWTGRL